MRVIFLYLLGVITTNAQFSVTVIPPKVVGQKAVVPLALKNSFSEPIESARAVVFLLDEQGRTVGQPTTRWVIGGSEDKPGLAAGATNAFHFVIASDKPFTTTNLTAKISFSRVVLQGGKVADISKNVQIEHANK